MAATEYEGALEELLEQLKSGYITPNTVECYFVEKTEIKQEYVSADLMVNLGYIAEKLNATKAGAVTYTVRAGDTFYDIAQNNEMSVDKLLNLNPATSRFDACRGYADAQRNAVPYLTVGGCGAAELPTGCGPTAWSIRMIPPFMRATIRC